MQAYTHFLVGICVQLLIRRWVTSWLWIPLVGVLAFASHVPVDVFARATYHPPDARPHDKFWVAYHVGVFGLSIVVAVVFWSRFWFAMLCATLVDVYDWGIVRGVRALKHDPTWAEGREFHPVIDRIRTRWFQWLPDWNLERKGVVPELLLLVGLGACVYLLWF